MQKVSLRLLPSLSLMCVLNIKKKLPTKEVEKFEDLLTDVRVEMKCEEWITKSKKCAARAPQSPKDVVKCDVHKEVENTNKPDVKNCPESDVLEKEVTEQETTPSHDVHDEIYDHTNKTDGEE